MARVTMAIIAEKAGVSKNTVSLALRHDPQIPAHTRKRIAKIAKTMGYTKNPVVAQLMTELRKAHPAGYRRTLALLNANQDGRAFKSHPTVPAYVTGCRRRAEFHGYKLDEFWLHDPELNGDRLDRILKARGIRGALIVGLMKENQLPERFGSTWQNHACVVTGVRTRLPTLPFCCVDHHALVLQAMEQARALGYERPALVVDEHIDRLVDGRFGSGMWVAQQGLAVKNRVEGFFQVEEARKDPALFAGWLKEAKPDVIFTLYHVVKTWIEGLGMKVPRDIGLIQLEHREECKDWAGMDQHNDQTGEGAVDMLVGMVHNNEIGLPDFPRATLISGSWVEGGTVRARHVVTV
ncbi:LacI family DNA-binding transcriptional regulator [Nibricoccus aquaticus]|nr:LacI family DNA-binding transcriptional regulator [Nibricoccus aquaticus]